MKLFKRDQNKKAESYRKENKIPGVIYGPDLESTPVYADEKSINQILQEHEFGLFEFEFENKKYQGILREIQKHPITQKLIHFDIYVPSLEKEIETKIPIEFVGESPVIRKGGVLNFNLHELEVKALPRDLLDKIIVDVSKIEEIGQSIYVKDLNIPPNIKVLVDPNTVIVTAISESVEETTEAPSTTNV